MKTKSKTGGAKLVSKKPASARNRTNIVNKLGKSPRAVNQKKDDSKKEQKKTKTKESEKVNNIPQKNNKTNLNKEEKD